MSFCTNCGINIGDDKFCTECGTKNILFEQQIDENQKGSIEKETSKELNLEESENQSSIESYNPKNTTLIGLFIVSAGIILGVHILFNNVDNSGRILGGEGELVSVENLTDMREKILNESKKHIGIPYSFGSKDPSTGFDDPGFVSYVYEKALKIKLPVGSKKQFSSGGGIMVGFEQLKPGDLMFFSHNGRQIQHVGIYIDENHFIHAPRTGRRISIDELGRYWRQKFVKGKTYIK